MPNLLNTKEKTIPEFTQLHIQAYQKYLDTKFSGVVYQPEDLEWLMKAWIYAMYKIRVRRQFKQEITDQVLRLLNICEINPELIREREHIINATQEI